MVLASYENADHNRCVDVFERPDGTFGFEEFRKDPEDMGRWTPVAYFSATGYPTSDEARLAATRLVPWFDDGS
jgi:hypothetical protein